MPSILVVEQDEIEAYADLAKDVLPNIFGLDSNKALLTDATALSDFFPAGLALSREDIDQAPYAALLERWPGVSSTMMCANHSREGSA